MYKFYFSNSYFFVKYINCSSLISFNDKRLKGISFNKNSGTKTHFIFHYNFLNDKFMSFLRSNFFKYSIVINSSKKSVLRRNVPSNFKHYFNNSSFMVSIPSKNISETLFYYKSLKNNLELFNTSSRFSIYFFSIFVDKFNIPIEFFDYFSKNDKIFEICNQNVKISYCIFTFFYYKQFFIFNKTFFKLQNT